MGKFNSTTILSYLRSLFCDQSPPRGYFWVFWIGGHPKFLVGSTSEGHYYIFSSPEWGGGGGTQNFRKKIRLKTPKKQFFSCERFNFLSQIFGRNEGARRGKNPQVWWGEHFWKKAERGHLKSFQSCPPPQMPLLKINSTTLAASVYSHVAYIWSSIKLVESPG